MPIKGRIMSKHLYPILITTTLLSACTLMPSGPNVVVLPGTGRNLEQFRIDDIDCQQHAMQIVHDDVEKYSINGYVIQNKYDVSYIQCMYAYGHRVPIIGNYAPAPPHRITNIPPTVPPPPPQGMPPAPPPKNPPPK